MEKTCTKCGVTKPIENFGQEKRGNKLYTRSRCRKCQSEDSRKRYLVNPEKVKEAARKWALANPEKISEKRRNQRINNPERFRQEGKRWKENNPGKIKEKVKRRIRNLGISYIKERLKKQGFPDELINNQELIEVKRLIIQTKRLCKTSQS